MHASKGLQYPLVYCPFVWDVKDMKPADWQILHTADHTTELLAKSQLNDEDRIHLADEEMAERLRLLYVADPCRRAARPFMLPIAAIPSIPLSPYPLEGSTDSNRVSTHQAYEQERSNQSPRRAANAEKQLAAFPQNPPEHTDFSFSEDALQPAAAQTAIFQTTLYQAAVIPARDFQFIRHTSFYRPQPPSQNPRRRARRITTRTRSRRNRRRNRKVVRKPLSVSDDLLNTDIHHFPRGANAGVCSYEMLEKFDFAQSTESQSSLIAETLTRYGFDLLDRCRQTNARHPAAKTRLVAQSPSEIPPERRLP